MLRRGTGACRLEVTHKYRLTTAGEATFRWTVHNTGTVACDGQWRLGWLPVDSMSSFPADDEPTAPGLQLGLSSPVSDPFRVYVVGLVPEATGAGTCDWAVTRQSQAGDPAVPTPDAWAKFGFENVGSVPCVIRGFTEAYIR